MSVRSPACVPLTSDFGQRDSYVGEMKGVMLSIAPALHLVDIGHDLPPQHVAHAARVLAAALPRFPKGSVHLVVVDPGVGTERAAVVVVAGGHTFVAPDNGVLALVCQRLGGVEASYRIESHPFLESHPSATFHGRDIFAPTAAALAAEHLTPSDVGPPWQLTSFSEVGARSDGEGGFIGQVINVDHFGNAVSNIHVSDLQSRLYRVHIGERLFPLLRTYAQVDEGEALALVGSDGWVEVAERNGSAAQRFGLSPGTCVRVKPVDSD